MQNIFQDTVKKDSVDLVLLHFEEYEVLDVVSAHVRYEVPLHVVERADDQLIEILFLPVAGKSGRLQLLLLESVVDKLDQRGLLHQTPQLLLISMHDLGPVESRVTV